MQKQKTIAKWLAIILLATIMIGVYLAYDAIANNQGNTALGESGNINVEKNEIKSDEKKEKYHTTLPRESEIINGINVSHVGGENDEHIKKVVAYNEKFFVFFESFSSEFDVPKSGLNMAYFEGRKLEKVTYITDSQFADCKLMSGGICLITKEQTDNVYLINQFGEIIAKNTSPRFDECVLNLHFNTLEMYYIFYGKLMMATINNNLDFEKSNYVFNIENCTIKTTLSTSQDTKIILESNDENASTKIVGFLHNKGFNIEYCVNKMAFMRLFTLGNIETNYILCGKCDGRISLLSLDNNLKLTAKKILDEDDGIIISNGTNFKVVCQDFTYEFCRHLDLQSKTNSAKTDGKIKASTDRFLVIEKEGYDTISTIDNQLILKIRSCENYRFVESGNMIFIFLETSSNEGVFRANFGGTDAYFLTVENIDG